MVGDAALGLQALLALLDQKADRAHLDSARETYLKWKERQAQFTDPAYDRKPKGLLRRKVDNPDARVRPELLAAELDRQAASDAIFTTDTGMATIWLSRFVQMTGHVACSARSTWDRWPTRCRRRSAPALSTGSDRWSRSAATAASRCCWVT